MKILWCHEVSYLAKPVYEYQDFPERLAGRGHDVEVIDFDEANRVTAGSVSASRTGEGTVTLSSIAHGNMPLVKYLEARWRFQRMLRERLRRGDVDAVMVYSVFINGTLAVELAREFGVPVVYRVLDAYHRLRPGWLTRAILRGGERYIYRHADRIVVTNEKMLGYVSGVAGMDVGPRMEVLDHGVDSRHFARRAADETLRARHGLAPGDFVAIFLGTTYGFSGLCNLVRRLPAAREACASLKLLIVGGGEQDEALSALVRELGLEDCVIQTGMVSYDDVPRYLSLADLALNPFEINVITRDIIPIKILQYQAAALPTLSTPLPDLLLKHPLGASGVVYSDADDADAFLAKLIELLHRRDALPALGVQGREFVNANFSVEHAVDRIEASLALRPG